jgi:hypothetical protein
MYLSMSQVKLDVSNAIPPNIQSSNFWKRLVANINPLWWKIEFLVLTKDIVNLCHSILFVSYRSPWTRSIRKRTVFNATVSLFEGASVTTGEERKHIKNSAHPMIEIHYNSMMLLRSSSNCFYFLLCIYQSDYRLEVLKFPE